MTLYFLRKKIQEQLGVAIISDDSKSTALCRTIFSWLDKEIQEREFRLAQLKKSLKESESDYLSIAEVAKDEWKEKTEGRIAELVLILGAKE